MTTTQSPFLSTFLGPDFLLSSPVARRLYHEVAATLPIVDVHNHLVPSDIADDRRWETITDLWLADDHYKWRAMRWAGVDERLITGPADPWDRFLAWARTVPRLVRNPLYVWTHLELRRAFDIDTVLDERTARAVYDEANERLASLTARTLLRRFAVGLVATTDDPGDDLAVHRRYGAAPSRAPDAVVMVPTFRPDAAFRLLTEPGPWNEWADRLGAATGKAVTDAASLLAALDDAFIRFAAAGARASDHGLASLPDRPRDPDAADTAIRRARRGEVAAPAEIDAVLLEVMHRSASFAHQHDGVLQMHLGPIRNASPRLRALVGRDVGADVMGDEPQAAGLVRFLGDLDREDRLPRTVLYNLNPRDNALLVTLAGAYARPGVPGLVQWGPPWWFNDHEEGMRRQLDDLGAIGQLGSFIGMLTDSRSILSMTRHELFRRTLCDVLGRDVEAGRIPDDPGLLDPLVADVCVGNTVRFFGFPAELAAPR